MGKYANGAVTVSFRMDAGGQTIAYCQLFIVYSLCLTFALH